MKTIYIILFIMVFLSGYSQTIPLNSKEITPQGVSEIGGVGYFNKQLYLLLPANIRYRGKVVEASESKMISQKYKVWDIFSYDQTTGILENMSKKWSTVDASPNGFCIIDDSTIVYTDNKAQLNSNNDQINSLFLSANNNKFHFTDPCWDNNRKRIYFSSDMSGDKRGMDIWYIETEGKNTGTIFNAGDLNSSLNELSPTIPNDTFSIFVSNRNTAKYDIFIYDRIKKQVFSTDEATHENKFFTLSPKIGVLYYITSNGKMQSLWKSTWSVNRLDNQEKITPAITDDISLQAEPVPEPEMVDIDDVLPEDTDFKLTKYFGPAKYELTPIIKDSLDKIAEMLIQNPAMNIVICGHSSPDGPDDLNMILSYYRANEAYNWLVGRSIDKSRIFRIYGGEYLYNNMNKSRFFSIFPVKEVDMPGQIVIVPAIKLGNVTKTFSNFGVNKDEADYLRFTLKNQLPVDDQSLLLLPIKDIHLVSKGETIYSISKRFGSTSDKVIEANNLKDATVQKGKLILIPEK